MLTDFGLFVFAPDEKPFFKVDDDGCRDGWTAGDGAPKDNEATDCDVFCFLREAETEGLGVQSWTCGAVFTVPGWSPLPFLHSLTAQLVTPQIKMQNKPHFSQWYTETAQ